MTDPMDTNGPSDDEIEEMEVERQIEEFYEGETASEPHPVLTALTACLIELRKSGASPAVVAQVNRAYGIAITGG